MKPHWRTILIDDEAPARARLRTLLASHAEIEIVGEARDVADAARLCAQLRPDLIFLDIQMPREDGFELLPKLKELPAIIFVTAHDRYAVRAFEVNALDYLLKPVHPDRLAAALKRVGPAGPAAPPASLQPGDRVALRSDRALRMVPVSEITHIEAEENYTLVALREHPSVLVRRGIGEWETLLPGALFVRVHRSLLVNVQAVRAVEPESRETWRVEIAGRKEALLLSRRASLRLRRGMEGEG